MEWPRRGRGKKRLRERFEGPLRAIYEQRPLEEPLPVELRVWLKCRQYSATLNGQAGLPQSGGYLDQDAELMLAFEVAEDLDKQLNDEEETRKKTREAAAARLHGTG